MISIIVVCYNAGSKLKLTLDSIYSQDCNEYEVIIKDGDSHDDSLALLQDTGYFDIDNRRDRTRIYIGRDSGIYDAMNQAVEFLDDCDDKEHLVMFLNCGDLFMDNSVVRTTLEKMRATERVDIPTIYYGNEYNEQIDTIITSSPKLDEFALFRNVPCHQVCFYEASLFKRRDDGSTPYNTEYRVRADYEHFLYSVYAKNARTVYMNFPVARYEGGGYSETVENLKRSHEEHRRITDEYMGENARKYRIRMALTGAKLRTYFANSPAFCKGYNSIKSKIYEYKSR